VKRYATWYRPGYGPVRPARTPAARRGQPPAFTQFVLANQGMVYNLAYRILGDAEVAAAATAYTFQRAFPAFPQRPQSAKLWLMRVAVAACQEHLHRLPLPPPSSHLGAADNAQERPERCDTGQASSDGVQAFLNCLRPDQRVAVVLADAHDLSYHEIADVMGLPVGVIRSLLSLGRTALRDALAQQGGLLSVMAP
jgi:RNA polymerase sigma-70 factor (ECF subfamily)